MRFSPYALTVTARSALALQATSYEAARWIVPGEPLALGLAAWVSALLSRAAPAPEATGPLFG